MENITEVLDLELDVLHNLKKKGFNIRINATGSNNGKWILMEKSDEFNYALIMETYSKLTIRFIQVPEDVDYVSQCYDLDSTDLGKEIISILEEKLVIKE
jgi:hypothetical protein